MLLAAFRLAFHFRRPVSELDISLREFFAWLAYLKLEPPDAADNMRTASLMAQITNMAGRALRDKKTVKPEDFLARPKSKSQSAEEQIAFMKSLGK